MRWQVDTPMVLSENFLVNIKIM
ncbi:hypothetical protein Egran_03893 [Elaphomyces granulatus]|uniref:Uncharacterized protein n=1 Tax=Elaphomyces granulatus TaxID=519963 RepID=A0A232LW97_9EURO|nr:hypothetical protein Egran_03893 [Elaphomyces granulatus]